MSIRTPIAKLVGHASYWFLHTFRGGGSSLPGKLALKIDPNILKHLNQNNDVIIVTGTNGKTMTTSLLTKIMREEKRDVITNPSGSNMIQGIVTSFLANQAKRKKQVAILEVDEANVAPICRQLTPTAFVLTNIFRDQMDRYGEIYTTYQKILAGIKLAPHATVIANGDAPIFHSVDLPNPMIYYGFANNSHDDLRASFNSDGILCPKCQHILHYHRITYANLGDYFCPNCHFHRPDLTNQVTLVKTLRPNYSTFVIDQTQLTIHIGGMYNIYNALAAFCAGHFLNVKPDTMANALQRDEQVFGRQEMIKINGKTVTLILVKNPVGLNQVFDLINSDPEPFSLGFLLNANAADGKDTSWIWDGNFEALDYEHIPQVLLGGQRQKDIHLRFEVAGVPEARLKSSDSLADYIQKAGQMPSQHLYILSTYTAMLALRKQLAEAGIIASGY